LPELRLVFCQGCGRKLLIQGGDGGTNVYLVLLNKKGRISDLALLLNAKEQLPDNVCPRPKCQSSRIFSWRNSAGVKIAAKILKMKGGE
jgi:hypothetical protein